MIKISSIDSIFPFTYNRFMCAPTLEIDMEQLKKITGLETRGVAKIRDVREPVFAEKSKYICKVEASGEEFVALLEEPISDGRYRIVGLLTKTKRGTPAVHLSEVTQVSGGRRVVG